MKISQSTRSTDMAFIDNILKKLRCDKIGNLCRKDEVILRLGEVFYGKIKRKKDKKVQVRTLFNHPFWVVKNIFY